MRNRERANNYYQRFVPTDSLLISGEDKDKDALSHGQPYKSNIIDHRSISSSHLMPAFAKRRFVISKGIKIKFTFRILTGLHLNWFVFIGMAEIC